MDIPAPVRSTPVHHATDVKLYVNRPKHVVLKFGMWHTRMLHVCRKSGNGSGKLKMWLDWSLIMA